MTVSMISRWGRGSGTVLFPGGNVTQVGLTLDNQHDTGNDTKMEIYVNGTVESRSPDVDVQKNSSRENHTSVANESTLINPDFEEDSGFVSYDNGVVSKETYLTVKRYTLLFILPVVALFGIVGNSLSLHFLLRLRSQDSITVYICALAVTDTIALICYFLDWLPVLITEIDQQTANLVEAYLFIPVKMFLRLSASCSSSYIVVIISVERVLAVTRPMRMRGSVLVRFPKLIVGITIVTITAFFLLNIWRYEISVFVDSATNRTVYTVKRSEMARTSNFFNVYGLVGQIVFTVISTAIVLVGNLTVIIALFHQTRLRRKMTCPQVVEQPSDYLKVTWMLVTVATIYFLSALPTCVIGIISKFSETVKLFSKEHYLVYLVYIIGDFLSALSSSVNFLVYVVFSRRFREDFVSLVMCREKIKPTSNSKQ
ncbi:FMRFamide receptor-like [Liolophura sinensis]|uniref:FMRFamide receptor-like n=1 Tax=Liolophura sinensis TaxID=3198878 RepID=UPI00315975D3